MTPDNSSGTDSIAAKYNSMKKRNDDVPNVFELVGFLIRLCTYLCDKFLGTIILALCTDTIIGCTNTSSPIPAIFIVLGLTSLLGVTCPIRVNDPLLSKGVPRRTFLFRFPDRQGGIQFLLLIAYFICAMLWKADNIPMTGINFGDTPNTRRMLIGFTTKQITVQFISCLEMLSTWLIQQATSSRTEQAATDKRLGVCGPGNQDSTEL
ncbi:hypothetical protein BZA77DRAFT_298691 [Pyronema omphalodes]|nr:hypothetical protein BZA77DRAFT_298691 [Pyronema omphalodes]